MNTETQKALLLNGLLLYKTQQITKEEAKLFIRELREVHGLTMDELISKTGLARSTLYHIIAGRDDQSNNQKIAKKLKSGKFDFDGLIHHFKYYLPKSDEERNKIKNLAVILMDCSKRGHNGK